MQREEPSSDTRTIHRLFADSKAIRRSVKVLPNGFEALTESRDPAVAARIQEHVAAMKVRMAKGQPIRAWDPLFAALFEYAGKIDLKITTTRAGVRVRETSADPYVVELLHRHAKAVSGFVAGGIDAMQGRHPIPPKPTRTR